MSSYLRPDTLEEVLATLAAGGYTVLAGGTDFYPARAGRPVTEAVLDISAVGALRGIVREADRWRIGAGVTWSELLATELPRRFDGLKRAAREIGGAQIQNAGTLCGNVCNASPAADGVPPLLTLDAEVELVSAQRAPRRLPLDQFVLGPRKVALDPGEIVSALYVPDGSQLACSDFQKLGARKYLLISITMVAIVIEHDVDAVITSARVAVGSCGPVARRLSALEAALVGQRLDSRVVDCVDRAQLRGLTPIDDVRASAEYRIDATLTLLRRMLATLTQPDVMT